MGFVLPATNRLLLPGSPGFLLPSDVAVPQGLVMYLPMGGDSVQGNNVYDVTQTLADTRAILNTIGTGPAAIPCDAQTGQGISFRLTNNTNGSYLSVPVTNLPYGSTDRTILTWLYITDTTARVIFEYGVFATTRWQWTFQSPAHSVLYVANAVSSVTDSTSIPLNRWFHIACRSPGSALSKTRFFLNGASTGVPTLGGGDVALATTSGTAFIAGDNPSGSTPQQVYGPQRHCDFRVYNRALSDAEIVEIYQAGLRGRRYSNSGLSEMSIMKAAAAAASIPFFNLPQMGI